MIIRQIYSEIFYGHIIDMDGGEIEVLMQKTKDGEVYGLKYEATIPPIAIREEDKDLLSKGATFVWNKKQYLRDQVFVTEDEIKFNRAKPLSEEELRTVDEYVSRLIKDLKWD